MKMQEITNVVSNVLLNNINNRLTQELIIGILVAIEKSLNDGNIVNTERTDKQSME